MSSGKTLLKEKDKPKKERSHPLSWWQKKCDTAQQNKSRELRKRCESCGGPNQVGHHYFTKSLSSFLRYDWRNLIPLCFKCHFNHHFKNDPQIHNTVNRKRGETWLASLESVRREEVRLSVGYYKEIFEMIENTKNIPVDIRP